MNFLILHTRVFHNGITGVPRRKSSDFAEEGEISGRVLEKGSLLRRTAEPCQADLQFEKRF
jgi:hypothetical protein